MSRAARKSASWRTGLGRLRQYAPIELASAASGDPVNTGVQIAICTPSFNQADYLHETIQSVVSQGYGNIDYWVQDGGSTDETERILRSWNDKGLGYEIAEDEGQADAINRGFTRVNGEIMAWLNSDDLLLPGSLETVARTFAERPDVDVVYGHRILIDDRGRDIGRWIMPVHEDNILSWADYIPQETLFWRRNIWDAVGGELDTSFRFALDWELLLRFRQAGANFYRIPRFLGAFRIHEDQKTSARIHSDGDADMATLRTRARGRPVTDREVSENVKPFLAKSSLYSAAWKLGLADYGPI